MSFYYAGAGIVSAFKSERNMKIHFVMATLVVLMGVYFKISAYEWLSIVTAIGMVIGAEVFNTAIETSIDLFTNEKKELAGRAKDLSAGAVLVFAIASLVIGFIIFIPKIINLLNM